MLKVIEITSDMAEVAHNIQVRAFTPLLEKYKDYGTNPATESIEVIKSKIERPNTKAYIFTVDDVNVGWVRVMELEDSTFNIAALSIVPEYQNNGIAQKALKEIEGLYPQAKRWLLHTIIQEERNCYLYEKLGYVRGRDVIVINDRISLVDYVKLVAGG